MLSNLLSASAIVLLSSKLAAAQTFSACNPSKGDKCSPDPAFGGIVNVDFTKGPSEYFTVAAGTTLKYGDKGAVFTIAKDTDAPTISSTKYLFFGKIDVEIQAAPGTGIVTSFVLQSDDLDEIDWEWLGGDTARVQTNYFSKGNTTTYDRGGFSDVASPQTTFHTYSIDWSPQAVVWSIDGTVVRTLTYASANNGATFPQSPMQIKLGTWDGGASGSSPGTVTWAGGKTPFGNGNGPYIGYYKSIKITDRSNGVAGATSYSYIGTSGTYKNIKVNTDGSSSNESKTDTDTATGTDTATPTGTATGTAAATGTQGTSGASGTAVVVPQVGAANGTATGSATAARKTSSSATGVSTSGVVKAAANVVGAVAAALLLAVTLA